MRVLLTGGTGFLGRYVLEALKKHNISTVVIGPKSDGDVKKDAFIEADLLGKEDIASLIRSSEATHLLHLAWYTEHGLYWNSSLNLRWVDATVKLVEAFCQSGGQRVVVAGTCAEYDWSFGFCREDITPTKPSTLYGVSKDATRRLVSAICNEYGVSCAWGRVFIPYGPGETSTRLIPSLIQVLLHKQEPFKVNVHSFRDFIFASDVAEAFVTLLQCGNSGAYNISSGQPVQLSGIVHKLSQLLNTNAQNILDMSIKRENEPSLIVGENAKLTQLGWKQEVSLITGLTQSISEVAR